MLLVPVFTFYFIEFMLSQRKRNALNSLIMIVIPVVLSFSMGVISGLMISMSILFIVNARKFLTNKKLLYSVSAIVLSFFLAFIVLVAYYPENPFFVRIYAIVAGGDASAKGRTYEAFYFAFKIAHLKRAC